VEIQGCAIPALKLYWKDRNVKVQLGLAKGKKAPDKRQDLKRQVAEREAARTAAAFNRRG
jgi:SsrA-binding protein